MFGSTLSFDSLLSGSSVCFKARVHPDADTDQYRELQREKERCLGSGIDQLRRLRTKIFETKELGEQQQLFAVATSLADQMADYCLADSADRAVPLRDHSYHGVLADISSSLADVEPQSKHHIVPSWVAQNLRNAAQDMLLRVDEEASSLTAPTKRLSDAETLRVLVEFTSGTNNLSIEAKRDLLLPDTRVAALLSGGLVYALMAKKIAERYGNESGTGMTVIAAAVDPEGKRAVFEHCGDVQTVRRLIVVDDVIDKGGTILCAAHAAEDVFTGATINSGLYYSYPNGRVSRNQRKHLDHLSLMWLDFVDYTEASHLNEARETLVSAYQYARENGVALQRGWYTRAARYFEDSSSIIGDDPGL